MLSLFFGVVVHPCPFLSVLLLRDIISLLSWITAGFLPPFSSPEASHPAAHCPGRLLAQGGEMPRMTPSSRRRRIKQGSLTTLSPLICSEMISPLGQNLCLCAQPQTREAGSGSHSILGSCWHKGTDQPMSTPQCHTARAWVCSPWERVISA